MSKGLAKGQFFIAALSVTHSRALLAHETYTYVLPQGLLQP